MRPREASSNRRQVRPAARIELSSFNGRTAGNRRLRETEAMRTEERGEQEKFVRQIGGNVVIPAKNQ